MTAFASDSRTGRVVSGQVDTLHSPRTPRNGYGVILCHGAGNPNGYMDSVNQPAATKLAAEISRRGIPCISGNFGGDLWGNDAMIANLDVARTVLSARNPRMDIDKVLLLGISHGGSMAVRYAIERPGQVAGIIGIIPALDLNWLWENVPALHASIRSAYWPDNLNPNAALDIHTTGWTTHNTGVTGGVWERSNSWGRSGSYSLRHAGVSGTTDLGGGLKGFIGSYVLPNTNPGYPVVPGETITASSWVNVVTPPSPGTPGVWQELFFYNSSFGLISQINGASFGETVVPGINRVHATGVAPAGAAWCQVVTVMATTVNNESLEFYVTDVLVQKSGALSEYPDTLIGDGDTLSSASELTDVPQAYWYSSNDTIALPTNVSRFVAESGGLSSSLGDLGHTDAAIAAVPLSDVLQFLFANGA